MNEVNLNDFVSPSDVVEWYYMKQRSLEDIAEELGISVAKLVGYMEDHGLPRMQGSNGKCETAQGPPCPNCGAQKSKIRATRWMPRAWHYRRRRKCDECGKWFFTRETTMKPKRR